MLEQKKTKVQGWKKKLSKALKEMSIINKTFTGKIVVTLKQGGVRSLDKTEQEQ